MKIYELEKIDYFINEKEAFDKSVFNPAEYDVTLAVETGTELSDFIKEGQQVSGEYTVNGLTTNFESLVQDVSISRQFQAGYDMYNLKLSENILNVDRAAILDVQDGGTGSGELNGILKGNGLAPVTQAVDGTDYWSPESYKGAYMDGDWLVEHMGGVYYRFFQVKDYGQVPITTSNSGQYISAVLPNPTLPNGFSKTVFTYSTTDASPDTLWWLMSQPNATRVRCGASGTFNIKIAITAIAQKTI